jgi:hypothetical protein
MEMDSSLRMCRNDHIAPSTTKSCQIQLQRYLSQLTCHRVHGSDTRQRCSSASLRQTILKIAVNTHTGRMLNYMPMSCRLSHTQDRPREIADFCTTRMPGEARKRSALSQLCQQEASFGRASVERDHVGSSSGRGSRWSKRIWEASKARARVEECSHCGNIAILQRWQSTAQTHAIANIPYSSRGGVLLSTRKPHRVRSRGYVSAVPATGRGDSI